MKKLLVLIALIGAFGCSKKQTAKVEDVRFEPKFTLNEQVTVQRGFLKGQTGRIINCSRCKDDGQGTYASDIVCYDIEFTINNEPRIWSNVAERELVF